MTEPHPGGAGWMVAGLGVGIVALLVLIVEPQIDLAVSGWFYRPGQGFPLADFWLFRAVMKGLPIVVIGGAVAAGLLAVAGVVAGRVRLGVTPRVAIYLIASLALGPGLLVNTLLKDHWGRARPHQIVEFGGAAHFTPAVLIADQCDRNCSFPSGHGALAFWLVAIALIVPPVWRAKAMMAGLAIGVLVGLMRIAQGAHFLSDVIAAAVLVFAVAIALKLLIIRDRPLAG